MRRFDGAVNWAEMDTYTRKLSHLVMKLNLQSINMTSSYLHAAVSKERAALLKLFNRSHESNIE